MCFTNDDVLHIIKTISLYNCVQSLNRRNRTAHIDRSHYLFIAIFLYKHTHKYKLSYINKLIILVLLNPFTFKYTLIFKKKY